jgi:hypothetical protein
MRRSNLSLDCQEIASSNKSHFDRFVVLAMTSSVDSIKINRNDCGADGTRTRDLLRDRQAF